MTALRLRPYQLDAVQAVETAWITGTRRPLVVLPTGGGKTTIFASIAHRYRCATGRRVLVLAHRTELIDQAARRIRDVDPDLRVGTVIAERDEADADVVVGSVQTLRSARRSDRLGDIGLIVTDEAHHVTKGSGYDLIFERFPRALHLGVTATAYRADRRSLGDAWDDIVFELPILTLIRAGYLSDVRAVRVEVDDLDLGGVASRGGDFVDSALGEAIEASHAPEVVAKAYLEHAAGRSSLLFAPTVAVAELMAEHLNQAGVVTEVVTGATPKDERRAILRRYEAGTTTVLSNVGVFLEGTDLPITSCVVMARPTKSQGLFVQAVGRALRPYPGKDYALVLDVAGATESNSLCSLSTLAGRTVQPGQSLEEAEAAAEAEDERGTGSPIPAQFKLGPVAAREVDLFAGSAWRWCKTAGGISYLRTSLRYWFLIPGDGGDGWDVCWLATKNGYVDGQRGGNVREQISELGTAMAWAEQEASGDPSADVIGARDRAWHKRRASDAQVAFAARLGIPLAEGAKGLEVSDAIDAVLASRALDGRILPYLRQTGRLPAEVVEAVAS